MQEDQTTKQNYLYKEIIEGGYDPELFQEFIVAENPNKGMNLQLWSMNQLKTIANKFKNQYNKQESTDTHATTQIRVEGFEDPQSPKKANGQGIQQDQFYKVIECKRPMTLGPIKERSIVSIDSYEKREGGLFQKSHIVFQVRVDTLKSCVMRRYSDFQALRDSLEIIFPGVPIPPLPKKGKIKRKQEKHLLKRMYILEKFLNALLTMPEVRSSQILQKFLNNKDPKDFYHEATRLKKEKQIPFQKLETINGQIQLKIDNQTNSFISKTKKYLIANQPDVKRIYKDFKGAAAMFEACGDHLNNIHLNCKSLSKNWAQYTKECELPQKKDNMFALISDMTSRYAEALFEQAKLFRKEMYSVIKYESFMMLNYIENLEKLSKIEETFKDHRITLLKKKQKLYDEGNISKWGTTQKLNAKPEREEAYQLMLPKETKELMKERELYALFNFQAYKQIRRNMMQNDKFLSQYLNEILQRESRITSKVLMIWADLLMRVPDIQTVIDLQS